MVICQSRPPIAFANSAKWSSVLNAPIRPRFGSKRLTATMLSWNRPFVASNRTLCYASLVKSPAVPRNGSKPGVLMNGSRPFSEGRGRPFTKDPASSSCNAPRNDESSRPGLARKSKQVLRKFVFRSLHPNPQGYDRMDCFCSNRLGRFCICSDQIHQGTARLVSLGPLIGA